MTRHSRFLLALISSVSLIAAAGCGTSGSNPVLYAEVQLTLTAAGSVTFTVDTLEAGGVSHPSVIGQSFTATSVISFFLENAAPPYRATFYVTNGDLRSAQVLVTPVKGGDKKQSIGPLAAGDLVELGCDADASDPAGFVCFARVPGAGGTPTPGSTAPAANPEVRFDVCAPLPSGGTCTTLNDEGLAGIPFSGVLSDAFISHQIIAQTPTIFFLEGARDSVSARFISTSQTQFIQAELFVNAGQPRQTVTGSDVTLGVDL